MARCRFCGCRWTITADDKQRSYADDNPAFTATYTGFVNNDTAASLAGVLDFATSADASSPAGTYSIVPSGLSSNDYVISYTNGTLTVGRLTLTVTADKTSTFGDTPGSPHCRCHRLSATGDSVAILTSPIVLTTSVTQSSDAGQYTIQASGAAADNYDVVFVPGTYTVTPAAITVTAATPLRRTATTTLASSLMSTDSPKASTRPP